MKLKERKEIRELKKQRDELLRIKTEIEKENTKMPSEERINEIVKGKKRIVRELSEQVRIDTLKKAKLNTIKGLVITLNIALIMTPYALVGGTTYGIMNKCDATPYHQNTKKHYEVVTELKNNNGESIILDEEGIEKYGKEGLTIYTPWEKNGDKYERNIFKTDDIKESVFEDIEEKNAIDLIAENKFDDVETEQSTELPTKENDFLVEGVMTYENKDDSSIKENSKGKIVLYSFIHAGITLLGGSALGAGIYTLIKKKEHRFVLDEQFDNLNNKSNDLMSKEEKTKILNKIKQVKNKD